MARGNGSHPDGQKPPEISAEARIKPEELPFYTEMMQSLELHDHYRTDDDEIDPDDPPITEPIDVSAQPFAILGYSHGVFYYLPFRSRQVVELSATGHAMLNLLQLADLSWWARNYPNDKRNAKNPVSWDIAADNLIRSAHTKGVFDPTRLRGRGAWWDDGRVVEHVGSHLFVDGAPMEIKNFSTRYVYEAGIAAQWYDADSPTALSPLRPAEASKLVRISEMLPWERPVNAKLFAGWIMCAMVCGALRWRPHIYLTGAAGTGKTWILENIAANCLQSHCLQVESNTTEAGIRAALGYDALPIIFDEAEPKDPQAAQRIQNVLTLMRSSSSSNGSQVVKSSATGRAVRYNLRSCFAFASISVAATQAADQSRISVLALSQRKVNGEQSFATLKNMLADTVTEQYSQQLHIRAIRMIPAIRRNAEIFGTEAAKIFNSQRIGDQVGALLAGAWALVRDSDVTPSIAADFITEQDWTEETAQADEREEISCLSVTCETLLRTEDGDRASVERSIGELIEEAHRDTFSKAHDTLKRHGIRVESQRVLISNSHSAIKRIMQNTPWTNWSRILIRLEGAEKVGPMYFGDGSPSARGVAIPLHYFMRR